MTDYEITDDEIEDDGLLDGWWNHRVIVQDTSDGPWYSIRECYYSANGKIWACSAEPDGVSGESPEEMLLSLKWMTEALGKPYVRLDDIPEEGSETPGKDDLEEEQRREAQMSETDIITMDWFPPLSIPESPELSRELDDLADDEGEE